ncbi:hypothetical protein A7K73_09615 [Candidatus Methylacidiphilum fumarolicum]|nr:hypothetical protein A7K73_09615 [Candidatus Methylacidiphilum fumarolicum]TFE76279.1 hypothetical protein A7D33_10440 [Candidatus Methylacidiphilum fumarolicum]
MPGTVCSKTVPLIGISMGQYPASVGNPHRKDCMQLVPRRPQAYLLVSYLFPVAASANSVRIAHISPCRYRNLSPMQFVG